MRPSRLNRFSIAFCGGGKGIRGCQEKTRKGALCRKPWYSGPTAPPQLEVAGSTLLLIFVLIVYSGEKQQLETDGAASRSVGPVADFLNCF